jgi:hypothetical protein
MLGLLEAGALDVGWEAWERFRIEDIENARALDMR